MTHGEIYKVGLGLGVLMALAGLVLGSIIMMAVGGLVATLGYGMRDYKRPNPDSVDPITVFALITGTWAGLGHVLGYLAIGTSYERAFFAYPAMEFLLEGQILTTLGLLVPILLYPVFKAGLQGRGVGVAVPAVGFETSDQVTITIAVGLLALDWTVKILSASVSFLGTFSIFIASGSEIAIFLLAWHWLGANRTFPRWTLWLLWGAVAFDTVYSLLFSYMRGEIVYPFFMVFLAFLVRKAVTKKFLAGVGVLTCMFAVVYVEVGAIRGSNVMGEERLSMIVTGARPDDRGSSDRAGGMLGSMASLLARNCQFDQLSQVARLTEEDGFYYGETLEYMTYVFIPRIFWPDKPQISPGQWFAEKIGRGRRLSEDKFSNSINMTLQGEFYLNFGWMGALLSVVALVFQYALFWRSTRFYEFTNNPIGHILGLAILRQTTVSSSAAGIVHLILIYLAMLVTSQFVRIFVASRRDPARIPMAEGPAVRYIGR